MPDSSTTIEHAQLAIENDDTPLKPLHSAWTPFWRFSTK